MGVARVVFCILWQRSHSKQILESGLKQMNVNSRIEIMVTGSARENAKAKFSVLNGINRIDLDSSGRKTKKLRVEIQNGSSLRGYFWLRAAVKLIALVEMHMPTAKLKLAPQNEREPKELEEIFVCER